MIMKGWLYSLLMLMAPWTAMAQEKELEINYIAHDHYTNHLLDAIDEIYQVSAYNKNRNTYLYLANADKPVVVKCVPDRKKEFEELRNLIGSQIKHNVWPEVDIKGIIDLLDSDDFIDGSGKPRYSFFTLNFYVTPSFFMYGYNETLIARLFWDLELPGKSDFAVNVYHPEGDGYQYDEEHIFGPKKLNGDYKVYIFSY